MPKPKAIKIDLPRIDKKPEIKPILQKPIEIKNNLPDEADSLQEPPAKSTGMAVTDGESVPAVLETNLIKGEIITFFEWQKKIFTLINAILIPIFLVGAIYLGLMFYQKESQAKNLELVNKFNELTAQITKEETGIKEIIDFQNRLKLVSLIFGQHIYWTNFFRFLEDNTIKEVYFGGFNGDTSGQYTLNAMAENYNNITEQINVLKSNNQIKSVTAAGGELAPSSGDKKTKVKFDLGFSILKSIFTE